MIDVFKESNVDAALAASIFHYETHGVNGVKSYLKDNKIPCKIIILNFIFYNMKKSIDDIDFEKSGGLVPVIVQDANTKDVLTLAYANKESLELAKKTGNSWFWSRSRNKLWMKGEESGNTQKIKEILVDCDFDAIIYLVEPSGPACHTGERVCFHNDLKK